MKLFRSLLNRQIVESYSKSKYDLEFTIEALRCHKDDEHTFTALETEEEVPPFVCSFNKSLLGGNMLAAADEDGGVYLFDVRKKCADSLLKGWIAHSNAIFDLAWLHHEPKLVTASGDQTAQLWDVQKSKILAVFRGHSSSVKSVDFQEDSQFVFATGARDGNIMIWDIRCNKREGYYKPVNTIRNCHSTMLHGMGQMSKRKRKRSSTIVSQDSQQSVTSVKYQDMNTIVSAGAVDGNIKVWDLRKNYSIIRTEPVAFHVFPYPGRGTRKHGFSSLAFDSYKSRLFANCTNDTIYMYDCVSYKTLKPLSTFQGHSNATFYVKSAISPDDQFLMSGSGDGRAYIWNINKPNSPPFRLTGHCGEVTSVAWCPQDQAKVATCSDDNNLKIWRVDFEKEDKSQFIGWCERMSYVNVKQIPDAQSKPSTPNTSPSRSASSSDPCSPKSLSPNPASKCSSPQQVLHTWLKSNTSKRQRETDNKSNESKRCCLEQNIQPSKNGIHNLDNEDVDLSGCLENISHSSNENIKIPFKQDVNKENIEVEQSKKELLEKICSSEKTSPLSEKSDNSLNSNSEQLNGDSSNINFVTASTNPMSPLIPQPASPDKEFETVLKHMRCIQEYFKPIEENSPGKDCER